MKTQNTPQNEIPIPPNQIFAKSSPFHGPAFAVDGNTHTYWQSIPSDGEGDPYARMYDHNRYIDIALDGTYQLSEIQVFNKVDGSYNHYYVYASVDGVKFDKIISKTSDTPATAMGDRYRITASASYLRLNMAYNSDTFETNLAGIKVYGRKLSSQVMVPVKIHMEDWQGSAWQKEWDKFESDQTYARQKTLTEMSNLVGRVLGKKWKSSFRFELEETWKDGKDVFALCDGKDVFALPDTKDVFTLRDGKDGSIVIKGNSGLAMASGFHHYLKYYANLDFNPMYGSNVNLKEIVPVGKTIEKQAQFELRYALNFCTYSYTMAFWNWEEYEVFLDWCAMNGINLMLDIVGQEEVLRQTFREFGCTDEEIRDYLPGPAYFAWFYMQNMYSSGGPLPDAWFEQRVELGRKIHDRMQTYGITPVIPGFAGQVPETFARKNQGAVLTPIDNWCGYTRPSMLMTYLPDMQQVEGKPANGKQVSGKQTNGKQAQGRRNYFLQVAEVFYKKQKNVFGNVSDYYAVDPFHEGGNTGGLDIAGIYGEVQKAMLRSDPDAVWVMQQWQGNLNKTKLSMLDHAHILALDLQADMNPQHDLFERDGYQWIYCMLHNFGGRMGMDGEIPVIAGDPIEEYLCSNYMKGIGIAPEAFTNSPVVYELLFDTVWSGEPIDYRKWLAQYALRRMGGTNESLQKAWNILLETVYADKGICYQGAAESVINAIPQDAFTSASTWGHSNIRYDKGRLEEALSLMREAFREFSASPACQYDLADVAEQVLCNTAAEYHALMVQAKKEGDLKRFEKASGQFLKLIDLSDQILSTVGEFLLGRWIHASRKVLADADDWTKDLFEYNARALITTWGGERAVSVGGLRDYSNRKWAGLTGGFYKKRWEIWIRNRLAELQGEEKALADAKAEENWFLWEYQWANRKSDDENGKYAYSAVPSDADLGALVQRMCDEFLCTKPANYMEEKL